MGLENNGGMRTAKGVSMRTRRAGRPRDCRPPLTPSMFGVEHSGWDLLLGGGLGPEKPLEPGPRGEEGEDDELLSPRSPRLCLPSSR